MVDYSKWDKMDMSSDDDTPNGRPNVTKFDAPTRVTFGQGAPPQHSSAASDAAPGANGHSIPPQVDKKQKIDSACTMEGDTASIPDSWTHNGGTNNDHPFFWSQTKEDVFIRYVVPLDTRAPILMQRSVISEKEATVVLGDTRLLAVKWSFEVEEVDWEIVDAKLPHLEGRVLQITLRKKQVVPDSAFWCKSPVIGGDEIDCTKIAGRKNNFADAWVEANAAFREKTKNFKPTIIG
eukprot:GEMP01063449.1.p1 GENE.GEMP01063449.1~~GEMP01063449.1.p1  ORF type:complete len:236 (+),score=50.91 GEMP01063449.1:123-830(+)